MVKVLFFSCTSFTDHTLEQKSIFRNNTCIMFMLNLHQYRSYLTLKCFCETLFKQENIGKQSNKTTVCIFQAICWLR